DCHAFAIDPRDSKHVLIGTDGGVYQSFDAAKTWQHVNNFPAGEFYRVTTDMSTPYRVAGGLQDNQNWLGPSAKRSKNGIVNEDWTDLGGGDGFYCAFDSDDPDVVYCESQGADLTRVNLRSGAVKELKPAAGEGHPEFRFQWDSPLIASRHAKDTLY